MQSVVRFLSESTHEVVKMLKKKKKKKKTNDLLYIYKYIGLFFERKKRKEEINPRRMTREDYDDDEQHLYMYQRAAGGVCVRCVVDESQFVKLLLLSLNYKTNSRVIA